MLAKIYKIIAICVISLVISGHHSFQVYALDVSHTAHEIHEVCDITECHHAVNIDICEEIENDEIHISLYSFTLPKVSYVPILNFEKDSPCEVLGNSFSERIPLSQKQLARSHL